MLFTMQIQDLAIAFVASFTQVMGLVSSNASKFTDGRMVNSTELKALSTSGLEAVKDNQRTATGASLTAIFSDRQHSTFINTAVSTTTITTNNSGTPEFFSANQIVTQASTAVKFGANTTLNSQRERYKTAIDYSLARVSHVLNELPLGPTNVSNAISSSITEVPTSPKILQSKQAKLMTTTVQQYALLSSRTGVLLLLSDMTSHAAIVANVFDETVFDNTSQPSSVATWIQDVKMCGTLINGTLVATLVQKLFDKDCGSTSIPMGVGTGILIFAAMLFIVGFIIRREDQKNPKKRHADVKSPIPSEFSSLLMINETDEGGLPPNVKDEDLEQPEVQIRRHSDNHSVYPQIIISSAEHLPQT